MPADLSPCHAAISEAVPTVTSMEPLVPYRVPFLFDRSRAPRYRLVNIGSEQLRGVTLTLLGSGVMAAMAPAGLGPTEELEIVIRGDDLAVSSVVVVRWLRESGEDYLWRVAF
jgi:hypothetical protein